MRLIIFSQPSVFIRGHLHAQLEPILTDGSLNSRNLTKFSEVSKKRKSGQKVPGKFPLSFTRKLRGKFPLGSFPSLVSPFDSRNRYLPTPLLIALSPLKSIPTYPSHHGPIHTLPRFDIWISRNPVRSSGSF